MSDAAVLQKKLELAKLRREYKRQLQLAFDGTQSASRPTKQQQAVLEDRETLIHWIVASNRAGKSQLGARVVSWWFSGTHPHMERPPEWGTGPLQILVVGRLGEQMESELWERKIKPFMREGEYKAIRVGNILQRVENLRNGNRMIFLSHHDAAHAREKVQAFTANIVWLDEMPDHAGLVTELLMRVLTTRGRMYATFTPLIRNEEIRKIVETPTVGTKTHRLKMLDNPIFAGREAEIEAQVRAACSSESEFRARMYGEWYQGDTRVFAYDRGLNRVPTPPGYQPLAWRHLAVVDPSASGLTGLTVWAESPETAAWYVVKAVYLKGSAAYELLDAVEAELRGVRVLWRWCDCNPAGFYKEAARRGVPWMPFTDKNDRKLETIDKVNTVLGQRRVWLTDAAQALEDELVKASWSATSPGKISGASGYHLIDTARYAIDVLPAPDPGAARALTPEQQIRDAWHKRKAAQTARIIERRSKWTRHSWSRSLSLTH